MQNMKIIQREQKQQQQKSCPHSKRQLEKERKKEKEEQWDGEKNEPKTENVKQYGKNRQVKNSIMAINKNGLKTKSPVLNLKQNTTTHCL